MASESKRGSKKAKDASSAAQAGAYDPSALLSLYSLYGFGGGAGAVNPFSSFPSSPMTSSTSTTTSTATSTSSKKDENFAGTFGTAASQAASLGMNQASAAWWAMASQLAAQEYLLRLQAAARDPSAMAALAAQASISGLLSQTSSSSPKSASTATPPPKSSSPASFENLKLPSDTEIIKYTSSVSGSRNPGNSNRGRKKTISLEHQENAMANIFGSFQTGQSPPNIPAGLTIERKKPGRGHDHHRTSSPVVDKVEITKVPISSNGVSHQREFTSKTLSTSSVDAPLNLSLKTSTNSNSDVFQNAASKIPSEYYASQALSGVFLAEQIRQQQLAAALESRLDSQSFSAMQAAMLLNKLKAGAETSKLLAAASTPSTVSVLRNERPKGRGTKQNKQLEQLGSIDKLNKDTVASLLAKSREQLSFSSLHGAEDKYPKPELTIEPIFKSLQPDNRFDTSDNGRRLASVVEDGKLKIKTVSESPEIRNLSDHDHDDENNDSDDASVDGNNAESTSSSNNQNRGGSRYATIETEELRLPLISGWKRETTVREYSKSGIRGDVIYYAPCGKKFKQYPDIMRYLEKRGVKNLLREHFSFSTKIFIGDFLRPTGVSENNGEEKYVKMSENEILDEIDKLRRDNGWKPRRRMSNNKSGQENVDKQTSDSHSSNDAVNRQEQARKLLEAKRKRQEEIQRQKQEEKIRKMREEQERRNKEALLKEQQAKEIQRQQRLMYQQTVERERRRQHMILMKQLESKKRQEDMNKKREEMRIMRERDYELRLEQKRLEIEIMTEMRRPLEDMSLDDHKDLPEFKRIPNLMLSGEAFANTLMVFEFLNNFGETLGFDMESLPTLSSLQASMLNDPDSEEELLSVMIHLLVCAIEDPGIPNPQKHLTLLGQNLRQADITNTNVTEILRIYLLARVHAEMRSLHGLAPPESYAKEKHPLQPEKVEEYNTLMKDTQSFKLASSIAEKTFLCLNPTDKSEILSFICNDLLSNKSVVRQIDNNVENVTKAKKNKWEAEMKVRKLKMIQARKFNRPMFPPKPDDESTNATTVTTSHIESECTSEVDNNDDTASVASESTNDVGPAEKATPKRLGRPPKNVASKEKKKPGRKRKATEKEEEEEQHDESDSEMAADESLHNTSTHNSTTGELIDEDERLGPEELQKKIEKTSRQLNKRTSELTFVTNCVRVNDLGQDRYRRRYWHFAHASGVYIEGVESSEPWKLATEGLPHFDEDGRPEVVKKLSLDDPEDMEEEEDVDDDDDDEPKLEIDEDVKPPVNGDVVKQEDDVVEKKECSDGDFEMADVLKKLGSEIMVTSKAATPKVETDHFSKKFLPKVTPNGDKLNLFNHTSNFNMQLSPVILNGSVTITPKEPNLNVPSMYSSSGHTNVNERPWFSILPLGNPIDHSPRLDFEQGHSVSESGHSIQERLMSLTPLQPQIVALEEKLESVRKLNIDDKRMPIPKEHTFGWWRLSDPHEVVELEASLNQRGAREHQLLQNVRKSAECFAEATKKPIPENLELEEPENYEKPEMLSYGCAAPDLPGSWSQEVALRIDKYILEQVEALEDKVQAASMQVPGWKPAITTDIDSRKFRPACMSTQTNVNGVKTDDFDDDVANPVEEAKERLLDLEANIERRYLKAPLGVSNADISLQTITSSITKPTSRNSRHANHDSHNDDDDDGGKNGNDDSKEENGENEEDDDEDDDKEVLPKGLVMWRDGIKQAKTAAQVAMAFYVLETSIAWHKSIMKAFCQLCHCGDNEDSLLLCDGCDKGYHTYCFKPTIDVIPEGDWYCFECINKATGLKHCLVCGKQTGKNIVSCSSCPRAYHGDCLSPALRKIPRGKWHCPGCNRKTPRKCKGKKLSSTHLLQPPDIEDSSTNHSTASNENKIEDSFVKEQSTPPASPKLVETPTNARTTRRGPPAPPAAVTPSAPPEKRRKLTKADKDLTVCSTIVSEMEAMDDAWPFLYPVNLKQFPTYKKIIKTPMDLATIKKKLDQVPSMYKTRDEFVDDVRLIFTNCEMFNEDDSPVGKAGHALRNHFETRWSELTSN